MELLKLGDRIKFNVLIERKEGKQRKHASGYRYSIEKIWQPFPCPMQEGIIVGYRILSDGFNEWDSDVGNVYTPETYFPAYIVATHLRQRHRMVKPENIIAYE